MYPDKFIRDNVVATVCTNFDCNCHTALMTDLPAILKFPVYADTACRGIYARAIIKGFTPET